MTIDQAVLGFGAGALVVAGSAVLRGLKRHLLIRAGLGLVVWWAATFGAQRDAQEFAVLGEPAPTAAPTESAPVNPPAPASTPAQSEAITRCAGSSSTSRVAAPEINELVGSLAFAPDSFDLAFTPNKAAEKHGELFVSLADGNGDLTGALRSLTALEGGAGNLDHVIANGPTSMYAVGSRLRTTLVLHTRTSGRCPRPAKVSAT